MRVGALIVWLAPSLVLGTFIKHLHPQERTVDRYIQYFIGLLNGDDDSTELFIEQRRASPELKRLLTRRQREMQERRRMKRRGDSNYSLFTQKAGQTGDVQWNLVPERGDLEDLREQVGDRLLKCLSRDGTVPRDVRDTITRYIYTDPMQRKKGDLEDLNLDDPRATSRPIVKSCLKKFEGDMISFLKQYADPDGESYLGRFQRLARAAATTNYPSMSSKFKQYDDEEEDEEEDSRWSFWLIFLVILLCLLALLGLAYGLWFFLKKRLEHRAREKIAKAAAGGAF